MRSMALIAAAAVCMFMVTACSSTPQQQEPEGPMPLTIAEFSLRNPADQAAIAEKTTDDDGGEAFVISNAKSNLDAGAYRVVFTLDRPANARGYSYLVFDMMTDNLDLLYNIKQFFPRFFSRGGTWVQFGCSQAFHTGSNGAVEGEWFTIRAPVQVPQAGVENFRAVFGSILSFEYFLMTDDMVPIDGRIYFRNLSFE